MFALQIAMDDPVLVRGFECLERTIMHPANAAGDIAPNWGRITSTVTTSRQIQLGLKYLF
jgi:hypothetical protein